MELVGRDLGGARTAWYAVDGRGVDRCVRESDYALFLRDGAQVVDLADPLRERLGAFLADVERAEAAGRPAREPDPRPGRAAGLLEAIDVAFPGPGLQRFMIHGAPGARSRGSCRFAAPAATIRRRRQRDVRWSCSSRVRQHPLLLPAAIHARFSAPLSELTPRIDAHALLEAAPPPIVELDLEGREALRQEVRDLLRHGGHKPTGRGKPSSEYLVRAAGEGKVPRINAAVDACNAVSHHTGLPISVDVARTSGPLRVAVPAGELRLQRRAGRDPPRRLLCLFDGTGPSPNAVKDSHGTKTSPGTGLSAWCGRPTRPGHARAALEWYASVLESSGADEVQSARSGRRWRARRPDRLGTLSRRSPAARDRSTAGSAGAEKWSGREDSNLRPLQPHCSALPNCATARPKGRRA